MSSSFLRRTLVLGMIGALGLGGLSSGMAQTSSPITLHGSITYRERMALPPATVEIRIVDMTNRPTQPETVSRASFTTTRQVPIPFHITLNTALLKPNRAYGVVATLLVEGQPWFKTPMPAPLNLKNQSNILLTLRRHGTKRPSPALPGSWYLVTLGKTLLQDGTPTPTLELHEDGTVAGSTICNQINATMTVTGEKLKFGPVATTRRACMDATTAERERLFLASLEQTSAWRMNTPGDMLTLLNDQAQPLLVFHRQSHLPVK